MRNLGQICTLKPYGYASVFNSVSCHPYHCKKRKTYNQALRLDKICSDNESFDRRCND